MKSTKIFIDNVDLITFLQNVEEIKRYPIRLGQAFVNDYGGNCEPELSAPLFYCKDEDFWTEFSKIVEVF